MSQALPILIAIIMAGAFSNKTHAHFSTSLASALDLLIFIVIYYFSYKVFKHYRDM